MGLRELWRKGGQSPFGSQRRAQSKKAQSNDLSGCLTTVLDPLSPSSEAYRALRTNLLYARVDSPPKVVVITSGNTREGKTTTCANLGVVLAQANKDTLLLDCDLRTPSLHKVFALNNGRGITDVLTGEYDFQEILQEPVPGLAVMTAGHLPPQPAELLSSQRFTEFLSLLRRDFEYVLLDSPPVGLVSDPLVLAAEADGVLLVIDAQKSRKVTVRRAMRSLEGVGAKILGTVVNNIKSLDTQYAR